MFLGPAPAQLASRFATVVQAYIVDGAAERLERARRALLAAVAENEPATLGQVAASVGRGAPAVSRSVDVLVRAGLIERAPDPGNRRRLAMRLTEAGREVLAQPGNSGGALSERFDRLAPSELQAIERAVEILERGH